MNPTPRRISALLWTVNLSSIAASIFSYVYLSYIVYQKTASVQLSEAVLIAPMVIPVVLCLAINRIAGASSPRAILIWFNVAGMAVALATYPLVDKHIWTAIAGTLVIGFLDATQRVGRMVAIKRYFSSNDVKYALPITLTAQFIAGAIAGIVLSFYKSEITPAVAGMITICAYGIGAFAGWLLPAAPSQVAAGAAAAPAQGALAALARVLRDNPSLQRHFLAFVILVSAYQGFFNVSRVALPTHVLGLSQTYVGYLQIIGATSALGAALLFAYLGKRNTAFGRTAVVALNVFCLGAMVGATGTGDVAVSYTLYFVYMFLWEMLFFKHQSDVVAATPAEDMPLVATFQFAGVYLGMIVTGLLGSWVTHHYGLPAAAIGFAIGYAVLMSWNALRGTRLAPAIRTTQ